MRIKGLRKKTSLVVIIPLLIGVILTRVAALIPTYIFYPDMLNNYAKDMIRNQKGYLQNSSYILSKIASVNYVQQLTNSINIGGDLMQLHYFYGLKVKKNLNASSLILNFNEYLEKYPNQPRLWNQSMWFLDNYTSFDQLPLSGQIDLNNSVIFDTVVRAISSLTNKILKKTYSTSYLTFSDVGLYCTNPSRYSNFSSTSSCRLEADGYYDPRCSLFYNQTLIQKGISNAVIIQPYIYEGNTTYGQSVCRAQWNYTNSNMIMTYCIDFNISDYLSMNSVYQGQYKDYHIYSYIVNNKGLVLQYNNTFDRKMINKNISSFEIPHKDSKDFKSYTQKIMPLFLYQNTKLTHYTLKGKKMLLSVSPVMMTISSPASPYHYASVALVMRNEYLENKFNDLKSSCNHILDIGNIVGGVLVFFIILVCAVLTDALSKSLISPIDDLVIILNRMLEGDLEVDIMASIKPSPKEIKVLYGVFDELRVLLRFSSIHTKDLTQSALIYSQALKLFTQFGNKTAMEICNRELGYICVQKELWLEASEFLYSAYQIFVTYPDIKPIDLVRRKLEVAASLVYSKERLNSGLQFIAEIFDELKKMDLNSEVCEIFIELAEIVYEAGAKSSKFFKDLHHFINVCDFLDKGVVRQRFLYIKALYLRNNKNKQEACMTIMTLFEEFKTYVPVLRMKCINMIKEFGISTEMQLQLSKYNPCERPVNKDIVLIISNSLAQEGISSKIIMFLESIINKNDRLALVQCYSKPLLVFNLTKLPMKIMKFRNIEFCIEFAFLDAMKVAIRQLEIKENFSYFNRKRQSWIVVVTDLEDSGSVTSAETIFENLKAQDISVLIINLSMQNQLFTSICGLNDFSTIYEDVNYENIDDILLEIMAYMCPEKEVIDAKEDEDLFDVIYY